MGRAYPCAGATGWDDVLVSRLYHIVLVLVLEKSDMRDERVTPSAWRGAALACTRPPRDVSFSDQADHEISQQAAPANNPAR
jgi:hypothetical protein